MIRHPHALLFAAALLVVFPTVGHTAVYQPPGLSPGDTYQLIFVTQGIRDANSPNIDDYHTFVRDQAALNPTLTGTDMGVQYFAVVSELNHTNSGARDNAVVSAPVYNFGGFKVADGLSDIWDGTLDNPVEYTQTATPGVNSVWTGSYETGYAIDGRTLGDLFAQYGNASALNSDWMSSASDHSVTSRSLYGLSAPITVSFTSAVPEPSTIALALAGTICLVGGRRRRRR